MPDVPEADRDSANNDSQTGATTNDPGNGTLTKPYTAHVICSRSMDDKGDYGYVFDVYQNTSRKSQFSFDYELSSKWICLENHH